MIYDIHDNPIKGIPDEVVQETLDYHNGNITRAAEDLGVHHVSLRKFLKKSRSVYARQLPTDDLLGIPKEDVIEVLKEARGITLEAARRLGVHRQTLLLYIRKEGISVVRQGPGGFHPTFLKSRIRQNNYNIEAAAMELRLSPQSLRDWVNREPQDDLKREIRRMRPRVPGVGGLTMEQTVGLLDDHGWNIRATARTIGVHDSAIHNWMRRYGFVKPSDEEE